MLQHLVRSPRGRRRGALRLHLRRVAARGRGGVAAGGQRVGGGGALLVAREAGLEERAVGDDAEQAVMEIGALIEAPD